MNPGIYSDFPAYILGITAEIWEGRGIHLLHDYYSSDIIMRAPAGVVRGNRAVIRDTRATLNEFPDRQLLGEDVIWDKTGEDSWFSSHRIISKATHRGYGKFGPATGKPIIFRTIADCHATSHKSVRWCINDEWLVRDLGGMARQIGIDPRAFACDQIMSEGGHENAHRPYKPDVSNLAGPYQGKGNNYEQAKGYAQILTSIMNAEMSVIANSYDRACQLELPEITTRYGRDEIDRFWLSFRSSFPDAEFTIDHCIGRSDTKFGSRAALRWSLQGRHAGTGMFGEPTGAEVYIMGMSHAEYGMSGIRREYVLFDTTAIWKQILLHTG